MERRNCSPLFSEEKLPPIDVKAVLIERGYDREEIESLLKKDVLFLSNSRWVLPDGSEQELLYPEMVEIKKILSQKASQFEVDFVLDKKRGHKYRQLLHAEIDLGLIFFLSLIAWDIAKRIISRWIYDRFFSMKKESKTLDAKVEIQVHDEKRGITYHVKYSGSADKVSEIIDKTNFK